MVRQSDVKGAYSKVGDPSVKRHSSSNNTVGRLVVAVFFLLVAGLFVSMGRTSSSQHPADADHALSGQAHHTSSSGLDNVDRPGASSTAAGSSSHESLSYYDRDMDTPPSSSYDSGTWSHSSSTGSDSGAAGLTHPSPPQDNASSSSGSAAAADDGGDDDGSSSSGSDDGSSSSGSDDGSSSSGSDDGSGDDASASGDGQSGSGSGSSKDSGAPGGAASTSQDASGDSNVPSEEDSPDPDDPDASEADQAEQQVAHALRQAEHDEVAKEEQKVQSIVGKIGSGLRIGLGRLFGDKASTEEIEELAEAVESEVVAELDRDVEAESTTVLNQKLENLETEMEEAVSEGTPDHEIAEELTFKRTEALDEMRHSIQEIEERVEKSIEARTSMAEKKVLEEKLSKKLGKTVKLTFVDDEEEQFGGLTEAIESLPSLRGTEADKKKKKKKKKKNTELGGKAADESTSRLDSQYGG